MYSVVLIGDSIRMGYEAVVRRELQGFADVLASQDNGGTTTNVIARFDEWAIKLKPDLVHLNCGLHDIARAHGKPPGVPIEQYKANVELIFRPECVRFENAASEQSYGF